MSSYLSLTGKSNRKAPELAFLFVKAIWHAYHSNTIKAQQVPRSKAKIIRDLAKHII